VSVAPEAARARPQALPWHAAQWRWWRAARAGERAPHAVLLHGPAGLGKRAFAARLARSALCEHPRADFEGCAACRGCHLLEVGTHPDFRHTEPPEDKENILIEQVRDLIAWVGLTTRNAGYRVALLSPAERLTTPAANTLLKTLEEPPARTLFVLAAERAGGLPATVRSRCQGIGFVEPPRALALEWTAARSDAACADAAALLDAALGRPLAAVAPDAAEAAARHERVAGDAVALMEGRADPLRVAERWRGIGVAEVTRTLALVAGDLARVAVAGSAPRHAPAALHDAMQGIGEKIDLSVVYGLLDAVGEVRRARAARVNHNPQLVLETLAAAWHSARPA